MRTLVFHLSGIGDFLLSCIALPALRADGPVELLGRPNRLQIAVDGGLADAAHDADIMQSHTLFSTPSPRLREFLSRFDRCVAWLTPDDQMLQSFRDCGLKNIHAFRAIPPADWPRHASAYYLQCLNIKDPGPLKLAFQPGHPAPNLDVLIHPGSGGKQKNWPLENFQLIAEELAQRGRHVTWCTGPAEEGMSPLAPSLPPMRLSALAQTLAQARLYIGNDSGITHLAAATGIPTIAIFGPTNPTVWAPRGPNVTIIQGDPGFPSHQQVLSLVP